MLGIFITLVSQIVYIIEASSYLAAVVEHTTYKNSNESPFLQLSKNLALYEDLTTLASNNNAQVIVFPEFGVTPTDASNRTNLYPYAEKIPSINVTNPFIPCDNPMYAKSSPILFRMSCSSRKSNIIMLINMIDWVDCDLSIDISCPSDGHYQYNTDVIFDEQGALVSKYHKTHEFPPFMPTYDEPKKPSYITYKSSFGVEFGLFICYDIMFERPAKVLLEQGIKHFLYAVSQTQLGEVVIISPWSKRNEAIVLSSNLGSGTIGDCSGILVNGVDIAGDKIYLNNDKKSKENIRLGNVPF